MPEGKHEEKHYKATKLGLVLAVMLQLLGMNVALAEVPVPQRSVNTLGGSEQEYSHGIAAAKDGGYVIVGESWSQDGDMQGPSNGAATAILIKYNHNGEVEWKKGFGGNGPDIFHGVATTRDGGYIVVGQSESKDGDMKDMNKGYADAIIVKYSANGQIEWKRSFGGSDPDVFYGVAETPDGCYVAVGESASKDGDMQGLTKGSFDAIVVKYKPNGDIEWKKSFGRKNADCYRGVVATADGGLVAAGDSTTDDRNPQGLNEEVRATLVKYRANGEVEWARYFGGTDTDRFVAVTRSLDGGIVAVGGSSSKDGDMQGLFEGYFDAIIVKYKDNGEMEWKQSFGGLQGDHFTAVTATSDGGIVAVGQSGSQDQDMQGMEAVWCYNNISVKYRADGTVEWKDCFSWPNDLNFCAVTQTTDGGIVVAGDLVPADESMLIGEGVIDIVMVKYGRKFSGWSEKPKPKPTAQTYSPVPVPGGSYVGSVDPSMMTGEHFTLDSSGKRLADANTAKSDPKTVVEAKPTSSVVIVNGKKVPFEAYNIQGYNYFKLRDIAMALADTNKRFAVNYDGKTSSVSIVSNRDYTPVGGELKVGNTQGIKQAKATESRIYVDGQEVKVVAYNIGGYNYFKLRDIAKVLNFGVLWDGGNNAIKIDTSQTYKE